MSNFRFTRNDGFPPVIKNLIIINVLVFVAQLMFESSFELTSKLGMWPVQSEHFRPYQFFTHMFTHSPRTIFHIFFNMFTLWIFGRTLENFWGAKRFLFFYLACGVGSAITHMIVTYFQYQDIANAIEYYRSVGASDLADQFVNMPAYVVGASGAVAGVMVAYGYLFPNTEMMMMLLPIPVKAKMGRAGIPGRWRDECRESYSRG